MISPTAFFTAMLGSGSSDRRFSRRSFMILRAYSMAAVSATVSRPDHQLVISIGDDEEVTRHGDRIITD
jgi:hypothetical protein